jgi:adiponectin receptor
MSGTEQSAEAQKSKDKGPRIGTLEDLHESCEYKPDNQFLQNGYRLGYKRCRDVSRTIFKWHNETLNIWTHLIGAIIFVVFIVWILSGFDVVTQKYGEMTDTFRNFNEKWMAANLISAKTGGEKGSLGRVINKEWLRMEDFNENLMGFLEEAEDSAKVAGRALVSVLDTVLDSKDDIIEFIRTFGAKMNPKVWVPKFANYHKMVIAVEKAAMNLFDRIDQETVDFDKLSWVRALAKVLPIREMHTDLPVWPIVVYLLTATFCLGCSAAFHWFYVKSARFYTILHRMDLSGITILIFGSVLPIIFYSLYCKPGLAYFYTILHFISCFTTFAISMMDWFHQEKMRTFKGCAYAFCGWFAGSTCIHIGYLASSSGLDSDAIPFGQSFKYITSMGLLYTTGLVFYIFRLPERWLPGKKWQKVVGYVNSHAIWHCYVFAAALSHMFAVLEMYIARVSVTCMKS